MANFDDRLGAIESALAQILKRLEAPDSLGGSGLRLSDCADFLNLRQYCAWRGEGERTVRRQVKQATAFVMPAEERPRLLWRRADCEKRMQTADVLRDRHRRLRRLTKVV